MPTDPRELPLSDEARAFITEHVRDDKRDLSKVELRSAPSVRGAQVPEAEALAEALSFHQYRPWTATSPGWHVSQNYQVCCCDGATRTMVEQLEHVADALLAAAVPVLLSEQQQRIEAALALCDSPRYWWTKADGDGIELIAVASLRAVLGSSEQGDKK